MSAYLSSCDAISALATYFAYRTRQPEQELGRVLANAAFGRLVRANFETAHGEYNVCNREALLLIEELGGPARAVFRLLVMENQRSLEARYPGDENYRDATGYAYAPSASVRRWISARTTGQLVGILRGYEYQSCEHPDWQQSDAYAICQSIRHALLSDLESRDCGESPNWASWQEPEQPRRRDVAHV